MKKSEPFDQIIKDKLSKLHADYEPSTWELLEEKLDAQEAGVPPMEDRQWDEIIFDKLHQIEAKQRKNHWDILVHRLDSSQELQMKVFQHKAIELALLLLIIFTLGQYLPQNVQTIENQKIEQVVATDKATSRVNGFTETKNASKLSIPAQKRVLKPAVPQKQNNTITAETALPNGITVESPPATKVDAASAIPSIGAKPAIGQHKPEKPISYIFQNKPVANRTELLAALERIDLSELDYEDASNAPYPLMAQMVRRRVNLRVGMFGSGDYNLISTPLQDIDDISLQRYDRYTPGYGGGISIGLDFGRWGVETGAVYAAKLYQPQPILYLIGNLADGYYGEGIKDIEYNIIHIPLHIRYNFINTDKWRAYALGGVGAQIIFESSYYIADQRGFENALRILPPPPQRNNSVSPSREPNTHTPLDDLYKPEGWLEGGNLKENSLLSGNIGLGLERRFSERLSVFTQPTYQHSIYYLNKGWGLYKDRIHTMSIYTGVRVKIF